jgi:hypothetical protein
MGSGRCALPLVGLLLMAGCGGGQPCRKACTKLASCVGVSGDAGIVYRQQTVTEGETTEPGQFTCTLSSACTPKETCLADCVEQSTCAAITGKDAKGALALRVCRAECELEQRGIARSDGGNPLICTPSCSGKQCGDDGCGGTCGLCILPATCSSAGKCTTPTTPTGCGSIPYEGCCSGSTLRYCESGELRTMDCSDSPSCGWDTSIGYNCGTTGGSDPSGIYPKTCK